MIFKILTNPRTTLETAARQRKMWVAAGIVGLWALLNLTLTTLLVFGEDLREQFTGLSPVVLDQVVLTLRNLGPVSAFLLPFVWWIGVSALLLLAANLFGGNSGYSKMLTVVGAACAPWVLGYAIQLPLGMVQLLIGGGGAIASVLGVLSLVVSLASLVWHVALVVIGVRFAAGTSYRGAASSCALTGLGCATTGFILLITVLTLLFLLSGAA
jgi:hypothetical protein